MFDRVFKKWKCGVVCCVLVGHVYYGYLFLTWVFSLCIIVVTVMMVVTVVTVNKLRKHIAGYPFLHLG